MPTQSADTSTPLRGQQPDVPRIEQVTVRNYRALKSVTMKKLTPLTVLLGPNGSGKSTLFDVFAFLSECFGASLRQALDKRGRLRELRTRGTMEPLVIELKYRETPKKKSPVGRLITYHLAIQEGPDGPVVEEEWLEWSRMEGRSGRPFRFLDFKRGSGSAVPGDVPDEEARREPVKLSSVDILGVSTLGQFANHPRVSALRRFITDWYLSYLSAEQGRRAPEAGPQERLSQTGDNLANVMQHLHETNRDHLVFVIDRLRERVPCLETVTAEPMPDGRLLLRVKDAPFDEPVLAKYASDGTIKMLQYLLVLHDPSIPQFLGIEEPENHLHPKLLSVLAEECRAAAARSQLMVTTHSPFFVSGLEPQEVWVLSRDAEGYTRARRTSDMKGIEDLLDEGGKLGDLWMEDFFDVGNPLRPPQRRSPRTGKKARG